MISDTGRLLPNVAIFEHFYLRVSDTSPARELCRIFRGLRDTDGAIIRVSKLHVLAAMCVHNIVVVTLQGRLRRPQRNV